MSAATRIAVVAHDVPYPPVHGGRMDVWNRMRALRALGVEVHLIAWADEDVTTEQRGALEACAASVAVFRPRRSLARALRSGLPTRMLFRRLPGATYDAELRRLRAVAPQRVFLDGLAGADVAMALSRDLGVPLAYRSHNVEHQYMVALARSEQSPLRRLMQYEQSRRTRRWEQVVRSRADAIHEISGDDLAAWGDHPSARKARVLRYVVGPEPVGTGRPDGPRDIDVLYLGSMDVPSQVDGLRWFLRDVAPRLRGRRVVLAGRDPLPFVTDQARAAGVEVVANPCSTADLYDRARVLVNPARYTSGVNIKMIEMLRTGRPVVSTAAGARGLSDRLRAGVAVTDSAARFAEFVTDRLERPTSAHQQAAVLDEHGAGVVAELVAGWRTPAGRACPT